MKKCVITFRSVTPAQRGEQVLIKNGYACTLGRTPRWMQEQGCGYSLHVACKDIPAAAAVLKAADVPYRKIYLYRESGRLEEMTV